MKSKKALLVFLSVFIVIFIAIIIISKQNTNYVKYYLANVDVDSYGNINVSETLVVDYKKYDNYIYRDIKYNKNHANNPVFDEAGINYNDYQNDLASFDESSVKVSVYRGDLIDEPETALDITSQVRKGFSYNNDKDKYGNSICCEPNSPYCESIYIDATNCGTLVDLMTFKYEYTINGMVSSYNDCAELNYIMLEYLDWDIKDCSGNYYFANYFFR